MKRIPKKIKLLSFELLRINCIIMQVIVGNNMLSVVFVCMIVLTYFDILVFFPLYEIKEILGADS